MKTWIIVGSLLAAIAVLLGAFGTHFLKNRISPEDLNIFNTGIRYHMYHALALVLIGILGFYYSSEIVLLPAILFTFGVFIFSGSLYFLVLTGFRWLGAITPIGGLSFIVGWILLAFRIAKA